MSDDEDEELCNAAGEGEETELQGMLQAGRSADATDCGVPAIQWAVGTDMLGTMRILLAAGADTEKRDTLGHTAFDHGCAVREGQAGPGAAEPRGGSLGEGSRGAYRGGMGGNGGPQ